MMHDSLLVLHYHTCFRESKSLRRNLLLLGVFFAISTIQYTLLIIALPYSSDTAFENHVIGTPNVFCDENEVLLDIVTAKPFRGNIYVKGHSKEASCKQSFPPANTTAEIGNSNSSYSLTLGKCGMHRLRSANPRGANFSVTVIVSFHPAGFITRNDRAFQITCFYNEPEEYVTNSLEVSHLLPVELNDDLEMPKCEYSVRSGSFDGPQINFANVGEMVFHVWHCTGPHMGILVKNCKVTDGSGEEHEVLDSIGCSLDSLLISEVTYSNDSMMAYAQSATFKYADSSNLFFKCQIRMCQEQHAMCEGVTPPKCGDSNITNIVTNIGSGVIEETVSKKQDNNSKGNGGIAFFHEHIPAADDVESKSTAQQNTQDALDNIENGGWVLTKSDLIRRQRRMLASAKVSEGHKIRDNIDARVHHHNRAEKKLEVEVVAPKLLVLDRNEPPTIVPSQQMTSKEPFSPAKGVHFEPNHQQNLVSLAVLLLLVLLAATTTAGVMLVEKCCRYLQKRNKKSTCKDCSF